ncbi:MAG: creatininase family protein, partial [Planctomycetota bacterium]|nr:creatininase family protein [Planctomycetota bacterium]
HKCQAVCLVPIGILERHGEHLPLGTDAIIGHSLALRAAAREPAVVFPPYIFGQIHEQKHWPGAIAIRTDLALMLLENLCDEIARNGLRKVVLLNCHGGNESLLNFFGWKKLEKPRPYSLYILRLCDFYGAREGDPARQRLRHPEGGHGDEVETSMLMALRPDLADMRALPRQARAGAPRQRLRHLPAYSPLWWYADYPDAYAGDARSASAKTGELLVAACVQRIAAALKAIKRDRAAPRLEKEFFARITH